MTSYGIWENIYVLGANQFVTTSQLEKKLLLLVTQFFILTYY